MKSPVTLNNIGEKKYKSWGVFHKTFMNEQWFLDNIHSTDDLIKASNLINNPEFIIKKTLANKRWVEVRFKSHKNAKQLILHLNDMFSKVFLNSSFSKNYSVLLTYQLIRNNILDNFNRSSHPINVTQLFFKEFDFTLLHNSKKIITQIQNNSPRLERLPRIKTLFAFFGAYKSSDRPYAFLGVTDIELLKTLFLLRKGKRKGFYADLVLKVLRLSLKTTPDLEKSGRLNLMLTLYLCNAHQPFLEKLIPLTDINPGYSILLSTISKEYATQRKTTFLLASTAIFPKDISRLIAQCV